VSDSLASFYNTAIAEAGRSVWRIRLRFAITFAVVLILPLLVQFVFFMILYGEADSMRLLQTVLGGFDVQVFTASVEAAEALGIFLLTAVLSIVFLAVVFGATWYEIFSFRLAVRKGRLKPLPPALAAPLEREIATLCARTSMDRTRIVPWLVMSRSTAPSVIESQRKIHLIVPLGMAWLATHDPKACGAMIAHEFGHVLQTDTRLWRTAVAGAAVMRRIVLPLQLTTLVVGFVFMRLARPDGQFGRPHTYDSTDVFALSVGIVVAATYNLLGIALCWSAYRFVARVRLRSEKLADLAAIIYADAGALLRAVETQMASDDQNHLAIHLPREERLAWIRKQIVGVQELSFEVPAGPGLARKIVLSVAFFAGGTIIAWALTVALNSSAS
jgi:hypothetical protein